MAAPSDLTATLIVTEAFYKSGISSPSNAEITRGEGYFLREIFSDITKRRDEAGNIVKHRELQESSFQISTIGISKYALPTDIDEEISITILIGTTTGTAQAGAAGTITLAAAEDATVAETEGAYIYITSGTGSAQYRQCTDYNTSTKVASISPNWSTNPDNTSVYVVALSATEMEKNLIISGGGFGSQSFTKGTPSEYIRVKETGVEYMIFNVPFDSSIYGILTRYYLNPNRVDLTSAVMTRLYNDWQDILEYGVAYKICEDQDDNKYQAYRAEYERLVTDLIAKGDVFRGLVGPVLGGTRLKPQSFPAVPKTEST